MLSSSVKVTELRRAFQQHIRDDRKELLPAVLKVLSDEEANVIAETVEDEMAILTKPSEPKLGGPVSRAKPFSG